MADPFHAVYLGGAQADELDLARHWPHPPRPIRLRSNAIVSIWPKRIGLLLFTCIWISLSTLVFVLIATNDLGEVRVARITKVETYPIKGGSTGVKITFVTNNQRGQPQPYRRDYSTKGAAPAVGQSISIRVFDVGPFRSVDIDHNKNSGSHDLNAVWILALADILLIFVVIRIWLSPTFERRLLRDGAGVIGSVTDKRINQAGAQGGRTYYHVLYEFRVGANQIQSGDDRVSSDLFFALHQRSPVLVLYQRHKPKNCMLYDAMNYEVIPTTG